MRYLHAPREVMIFHDTPNMCDLPDVRLTGLRTLETTCRLPVTTLVCACCSASENGAQPSEARPRPTYRRDSLAMTEQHRLCSDSWFQPRHYHHCCTLIPYNHAARRPQQAERARCRLEDRRTPPPRRTPKTTLVYTTGEPLLFSRQLTRASSEQTSDQQSTVLPVASIALNPSSLPPPPRVARRGGTTRIGTAHLSTLALDGDRAAKRTKGNRATDAWHGFSMLYQPRARKRRTEAKQREAVRREGEEERSVSQTREVKPRPSSAPPSVRRRRSVLRYELLRGRQPGLGGVWQVPPTRGKGRLHRRCITNKSKGWSKQRHRPRDSFGDLETDA